MSVVIGSRVAVLVSMVQSEFSALAQSGGARECGCLTRRVKARKVIAEDRRAEWFLVNRTGRKRTGSAWRTSGAQSVVAVS